MDGNKLLDALSKAILIPKNEYKGVLLKNQRYEKGKETWNFEKCFNNQSYAGNFVHDCLHGPGEYIWKVDVGKTVYEGLFYKSKLEGYGKISNKDNSYFEGLFRRNSRFGPGVFTSANGSQDVGMWYGKQLMRLCFKVQPEWVPRIAYSAKAKVHLLKYKTLVKICEKVKDYGDMILQSVDASNGIQPDKLYNIFVGHTQSLFFNRVLYDKKYFSSEDCYIEIVSNSTEQLDYISEMEEESFVNDGNFYIEAKNESSSQSLVKLRIKNLQEELELIEKDLSQLEDTRQASVNKNLDLYALELVSYVEREKKSVCWDIDALCNRTSESISNDDSFEFEFEDRNLIDIEAQKSLNIQWNTLKLLKIKKMNLLQKIEHEESQLQNSLVPNTKQFIKKILATDILAWNNEEISIEMMKHAFLHRNFEKTVSFCVAKLLSGDRSEFKECGNYERDCITFLTHCSNGNFNEASNLLITHDLNPDMCDACGNTGLIFAVSRDRHKTIKTLINFGANVDVFNDECLTPLSICILRYLATQNAVSDWECAFFGSTFEEEDSDNLQWRPQISDIDIPENSLRKHVSSITFDNKLSNYSRLKLEAMSDIFAIIPNVLSPEFTLSSLQLRLMDTITKDLQEPYSQDDNAGTRDYLFNLECIRPKPITKEKSKDKGKKDKKPKKEKKEKTKKGKTEKDPTEIAYQLDSSPAEIVLRDKLRTIRESIVLLLGFGADPNISEVPMPVLLMSLFTKNVQLVEDLLLNKADPNVTTVDDGLCGFHILCSLPPCEELICAMEVLFRYGGNPNIAANVQHWRKEKEELISNRLLEKEDKGKLPLHLLAMRHDFVTDTNDYLLKMAKNLIEYGSIANKLYLGHTPLSLATLRGNVKLVRTLLETGKVNPNGLLGEEMGVALTIGILKRYPALSSLSSYKEVVDTLVQFGANPFNSTGKRGNVIEFICDEYEPEQTESSKKGKEKSKAKPSKKGKKPKDNVQDQIKLLLQNVASETLQKHLKSCAMKHLYYRHNRADKLSESMARFLDVSEVISITQKLIHKGSIPVDSSNHKRIREAIKFVANINYPSSPTNKTTLSNVDAEKMLESFEFKKLPPQSGYLNLPQPEVDKHFEKYQVCFYCFRKLNRELFSCPNCNIVYFCSEKCNLLSNKAKSIHKCGVNFYASEKGTALDLSKQQLSVLNDSKTNSFKNSKVDRFQEHKQSNGLFVKEPDQNRQLDLTAKSKSQKSSNRDRQSSFSNHLDSTNKFDSTGRVNRKDDLCRLDSARNSTSRNNYNNKPNRTIRLNSPLEKSSQNSTHSSQRRQDITIFRNFNNSKNTTKKVHPSSRIVKNKYSTKDFKTIGKKVTISSQLDDDVINTSLEQFQGECEKNKKKLPKKYRYFLEKIEEIWPDFDLSVLFLPYACYSDGQLYYRFDKNDPIFADTYSIV